MVQWKLIAVSLVLMIILASCAAPVSEHVRLPGELSGWKLGHKTQDRLSSSVHWEHIPEGEYISMWTRRYSVQYYDTKERDLLVFMNKLRTDLTKKCKTIQWQVIDKQPDAILYEWRSMGCSRFKEQHEIARLIRGKKGLHRVAYAEKKRDIPKDTYQQWKKKFLGAYLETGSQ